MNSEFNCLSANYSYTCLQSNHLPISIIFARPSAYYSPACLHIILPPVCIRHTRLAFRTLFTCLLAHYIFLRLLHIIHLSVPIIHLNVWTLFFRLFAHCSLACLHIIPPPICKLLTLLFAYHLPTCLHINHHACLHIFTCLSAPCSSACLHPLHLPVCTMFVCLPAFFFNCLSTYCRVVCLHLIHPPVCTLFTYICPFYSCLSAHYSAAYLQLFQLVA